MVAFFLRKGTMKYCNSLIMQAELYWREGLEIANRAGESEALAYLCGVFGSTLCDYE
jgi:hypothetical protein